MTKSLRQCAVCGFEYPVCRTCEEIQTFKPWRTVVDTAEHYKIHIILSDYTNKRITKHEAREMLGRCDTRNYKSFLPHIAAVIEEILKKDEKTSAKSDFKRQDEHRQAADGRKRKDSE